MKQGLVVADSGPAISLAVIDQLELLDHLFGQVYIPAAVWEELTKAPRGAHDQRIVHYFSDKVKAISGLNELAFMMGYGESEAVMLVREMHADFLLIDDKKARAIAAHIGIRCIGTIGILSFAKTAGIISQLRPLFEALIHHKRYYALPMLNAMLRHHGEGEMTLLP